MQDFSIKLTTATSMTNFDQQHVLFNKKSGKLFGLTGSSFYLVSLLLKSSFEETIKEAKEYFKVDGQLIRDDLQELVSNMEDQGLVEKMQLTPEMS